MMCQEDERSIQKQPSWRRLVIFFRLGDPSQLMYKTLPNDVALVVFDQSQQMRKVVIEFQQRVGINASEVYCDHERVDLDPPKDTSFPRLVVYASADSNVIERVLNSYHARCARPQTSFTLVGLPTNLRGVGCSMASAREVRWIEEPEKFRFTSHLIATASEADQANTMSLLKRDIYRMLVAADENIPIWSWSAHTQFKLRSELQGPTQMILNFLLDEGILQSVEALILERHSKPSDWRPLNYEAFGLPYIIHLPTYQRPGELKRLLAALEAQFNCHANERLMQPDPAPSIPCNLLQAGDSDAHVDRVDFDHSSSPPAAKGPENILPVRRPSPREVDHDLSTNKEPSPQRNEGQGTDRERFDTEWKRWKLDEGESPSERSAFRNQREQQKPAEIDASTCGDPQGNSIKRRRSPTPPPPSKDDPTPGSIGSRQEPNSKRPHATPASILDLTPKRNVNYPEGPRISETIAISSSPEIGPSPKPHKPEPDLRRSEPTSNQITRGPESILIEDSTPVPHCTTCQCHAQAGQGSQGKPTPTSIHPGRPEPPEPKEDASPQPLDYFALLMKYCEVRGLAVPVFQAQPRNPMGLASYCLAFDGQFVSGEFHNDDAKAKDFAARAALERVGAVDHNRQPFLHFFDPACLTPSSSTTTAARSTLTSINPDNVVRVVVPSSSVPQPGCSSTLYTEDQVNGNYIGKLNEYLQQKCKAPAKIDVTEVRPSVNLPSQYGAYTTIFGVKYEVDAIHQSKTEARQHLAKEAMRGLKILVEGEEARKLVHRDAVATAQAVPASPSSAVPRLAAPSLSILTWNEAEIGGNYIGKLNEYTQKARLATPAYNTVVASDGHTVYTVQVGSQTYVSDPVGIHDKKAGKQIAARKAMQTLGLICSAPGQSAPIVIASPLNMASTTHQINAAPVANPNVHTLNSVGVSSPPRINLAENMIGFSVNHALQPQPASTTNPYGQLEQLCRAVGISPVPQMEVNSRRDGQYRARVEIHQSASEAFANTPEEAKRLVVAQVRALMNASSNGI